jgi:cell division protein FtsW
MCSRDFRRQGQAMRKESIAILSIVLALVLIGFYSVFSAGAAEPYGDARLIRQCIYLLAGLFALFAASHFDYHFFQSPFMFRFITCVTIGLLIAVLIPGIGVEINGARRWIDFGGFRFQPSELAKFALILLLSIKLSANQDVVARFKEGYVPSLAIMCLFAVLVLAENDLGTPVVMCVTAFTLFFVAGIRWYYLIPSLIPAGAALGLMIAIKPHRRERLVAFMDPWADRGDSGLQLIESMTAYVKGDLWGVGAGAGEQKLHYLPEADTDFILTVWAEEMGLVGTLFVAFLFVALLMVSVRVATHARDLFGTLLASGIAGLIVFQAAFNMSVTIGLLPTKGLPLPFISRGGTSLIVLMGMAGILINIGLQAESPKRKVVQPVPQT